MLMSDADDGEEPPAFQVRAVDGRLVGYVAGRRYTIFGDETDEDAQTRAELWVERQTALSRG